MHNIKNKIYFIQKYTAKKAGAKNENAFGCKAKERAAGGARMDGGRKMKDRAMRGTRIERHSGTERAANAAQGTVGAEQRAGAGRKSRRKKRGEFSRLFRKTTCAKKRGGTRQKSAKKTRRHAANGIKKAGGAKFAPPADMAFIFYFCISALSGG